MASSRVSSTSIGEHETPAEVREMFRKYTAGGTYMTAEQLRRFHADNQAATAPAIGGATAAEKIVEEVLRKRHHISSSTPKISLSLDDFFYYLFSVDMNPPFQPQVCHDMTAPLSHYFIFTGHNSYLTGNQLTSESSDTPIIKALKDGVRVIELDLWPPKKSKDDIRVVHGRTPTSPVDLLKCLKSIKEYAFVSSDYPVILTLEDHLDQPHQEKAAKMITDTFGSMLYIHPDSVIKFPSPQDLKKKILISTKPPKEHLEAQDPKDGEQDQVDPNDYLEPLKYKTLIAIHQRKKSRPEELLRVLPNERCCRVSLSEKGLQDKATSQGKHLIWFTQKNILRIYPKGSRVNSSNYDPFTGWMHGAQMVAFNMQGHGKWLRKMYGMFRANGGCGYVKKPDFLMNETNVFDPTATLQVKKTLKVKVFMGDGWQTDFKETYKTMSASTKLKWEQVNVHMGYESQTDFHETYCLPDFYIKVDIAGVPGDQLKCETMVKHDQWIPVWNEEFTFPLTVPELALLTVRVYDHNNGMKRIFGGQTCLPVSELKEGIRAIPLYDKEGVKYPSVKLLMRFKFI